MTKVFLLVLLIGSADGSTVHQRELGVYNDKFNCEQAAQEIPQPAPGQWEGQDLMAARLGTVCLPLPSSES